MASNTPSKLALGQIIIAALVAVSSKLIKVPRDAFTKAFRALADAEAAVTEAEARVDVETARCQAADEEQDRATIELATKMSGDGFGRLNPFKSFGIANPSKLCNMGDAEEAEIVIGLSARVMVHPKTSPATQKAAARVDHAAKNMREADAARRKALDARAAAIDHRNGDLQKTYAVALTNLRSAVKYADYAENTAHYVNVFPRVRRAKKKKKLVEPVS